MLLFTLKKHIVLGKRKHISNREATKPNPFASTPPAAPSSTELLTALLQQNNAMLNALTQHPPDPLSAAFGEPGGAEGRGGGSGA